MKIEITNKNDVRRVLESLSFWSARDLSEFLKRAVCFTIGLSATLLFMFPFYWLLRIAFTWPADITGLTNITLFTLDLAPYNFVRVYYEIDFLRYLFNSVVITALSVVGTLIINSLAGYALRLNFYGKRFVLITLVGALMVPTFVTVIPAYLISRNLGLLNTHLGVALPFMAGIIGTLLFWNSFKAVPDSTIEAARLDGASELYIIFGVLWPLSRPAIATNVILTFISAWNSYMWPLVIITESDLYPLPLAIASFTNQFAGEYELAYAFTILVLLPVVIVFLLLQREFINSVVYSTLKE